MLTNLEIFLAINGLAGQFAWLDTSAIIFADYAAYTVALISVVVFFFPKHHRTHHRRMLLLALFSGLVAHNLIKPLIVLFYPLPRPFITLHSLHKLISVPTVEFYQSFPSGHALFFFAFSTMIYFFNKRLGLWLLALSAVMAIARVFCGVHWPFDIIAGALIGTVTSILIHKVYLFLKQKTGQKSGLSNR